MTKGGKITIGVVAGVLVIGGILYAFRKQIFGKGSSEYDQDTNDGGGSLPIITISEFPLKKGSRGDNVRKLQRALICSKYLDQGEDDGVWGNKTQSAYEKSGIKIKGISKSQLDSVLRDLAIDASRRFGSAYANACK